MSAEADAPPPGDPYDVRTSDAAHAGPVFRAAEVAAMLDEPVIRGGSQSDSGR